ncbi:MAG: RagB/SusD family nutrient uptake outer membrane protein [Bacteroidota bacterium]
MKKYIVKSLLIAGLIGASSCDVTDLTPQNALSEATAFTTPERIELAVTGVYDAANSGFYLGGAVRGYPFGAAHVEQGDCRGEDVLNTQLFYAITYESTYDPTTANNDFHWQTLYALINRANVVLAGLDKAVPTGTFTQAAIDAYKGECRFLRALAHHELLKHFARPYSDNPTAAMSGVPYRTLAVVGSESAAIAAAQGRNTTAECYDLLIADLDYAESVLPETRANAGLKLTRATKAAAVALKTRIYLHKADYAKVVSEGNKLASQNVAPFSPAAGFGTYALLANPFGPFGAGNKGNNESIFSIENSAEDNPGVNGALPTMYNVSKTPVSGRGLVGISPVLWNQTWFLASDARKSATFTDNDNVSSSGKGAKFTKKYADATSRSDNAPVIRYAEVLLNMAEAIQRQAGGTPDARAFAMYNAVRSRSVADPATDNIADFATGNALIQAILNERRIEFVSEGLRWGDIHRLAQDPTFGTNGIPAKCSRNISNYSALYTGDPATTFATHAFIPYSDRRFVWPIPASETTINPVLAAQQNAGY